MNYILKLVNLSALTLSLCGFASSQLLDGRQILGQGNANLTDYTLKGNNALFEIADLANHIPESFVLSKRSADDVRQRIVSYDLRGADAISAGGFVGMFLDLIENDDDSVYLLKTIDLRLRMLRDSSTNYTIVMSQWLAVRDPTYECLSKYMSAIKITGDSIHALWAYASAKSSGRDSNYVFEKLDAFRNICQNNACKNATDILLSGLNGGSNQIFKCDLIDVLYQGLPG